LLLKSAQRGTRSLTEGKQSRPAALCAMFTGEPQG
jgi:hypothetical protein